MKILNKPKNLTIALLLILTMITAFFAVPNSYAHTPSWKIPTYTYVTATPDPVGVGQTVTIAWWLDKMPPTAAGKAGDRWQDITIEITAPSGSKDVIGPSDSDPVGCGYTMYTPSETGLYTIFVKFPGQVLSRSGATGIAGTASDYENDTYLPSNTTITLTVQQEAIKQPTSYPLPEEYWTRPIEGQNGEWYKIASNWLAGAQIVQKVQPDGTAPNSAHIMWTRAMRDGGVVGGTNTRENGTTYYDGTEYEMQLQNPVAMYGRLYYTVPLSSTGGSGGYMCVDIRTGEKIWSSDTIGATVTAPTFGQLYAYESMNQHGVIPNGYLWTANFANAYDPLTGKLLFNLTGVPSGTDVYGPNGEILRYVLDSSGKWLACWNNTAGHDLTGSTIKTDYTSTGYNQWRPIGKSVNMSDAYSWNTTISQVVPSGSAIRQVIYGDLVLGSSGSFGGVSDANAGYTMWAISIKPESLGRLLWTKTYAAPEGNVTRSFRFIDPINRVFIFWDKETITYSAYSLDTGEFKWTTASENPWNLYAGGGGAIWTQTTAYGKLYSTGYSGVIYCYDTKTGDELWNFSTAAMAGFTTPYGGYPLGICAVADGKIYFHTNEHSSDAPYWQGAPMICLNATTGTELWTIPFHGSSGYVPWGYVVADGYLVGLNLFDEQLYCFGKGPTATTLNAPDTSVELGKSLVIKGTVTDIAAGTKQNEQAARFPNGVPAVSDASMSAWMQYVYQQKPRPTNTTGVQVKLSVIDSNNNYRDIGEVTSNDDGFFSLTYQPDIAGTYTVYATFEGSDSYWGSHAVSSFVVEETAPTATQTAVVIPDNQSYILGVGVAMIIAIAIGFAVTILVLRKRP